MLLGTIFQSVTAWQKLSAIPLKPSVAYKLLKYTRFVSAEHEIAEKQRVALIHEVTDTKDGEDAKIEPGSDKFVEYATRFNEIMATEVKFEQIKLNLEDVVELLDDKPDALSVSDLALLEPFFEDYVMVAPETCEQRDTCTQEDEEACFGGRRCDKAVLAAAGEIS